VSLCLTLFLKESGVLDMAKIDWSDCPLVEMIPGKVSGAALLKNTRPPVEVITGSYDAFRGECLSSDEAVAETRDCYPEAGADAIRAILRYRTNTGHRRSSEDFAR
jgi:uncharacterized protein (DUF433 family)